MINSLNSSNYYKIIMIDCSFFFTKFKHNSSKYEIRLILINLHQLIPIPL